MRERAIVSQSFDLAEIARGAASRRLPSIGIAMAPLVIVVRVNYLMNMVVFRRIDALYLAQAR
ncbi:hypothetical protein [Achromobacter agilis]|uniref:hypothetical protein n=1 Tax=Achromobacter agilis TaxID=1353888 RepID=UPI001ABFC43D|nr:hypothetical protein [Achromobacter agilis]